MKYGILIALMGVLWGTSWTITQEPAQSKPVIKRVSKTEFKKQLNTLKDVQLIDVRTPGEYQRGTIDGAINIDFMSSDFTSKISKLDKSKPTLIFCQSGGRSAKALYKFKQLGFEYVLELEGGYGNWK
ncbi:MAG: rhodanese-like domain-containing protein [Crocinitomicaceae bacterium]|nr:rhodanese-like domain-containing protein [Crocinitomicaceae bacterium]